MERTISGMSGKGSVSHNTRAFTAKNVDSSRSAGNVQFCHSDIRQVYYQLFDEALEKYNAKQKRNDRKIDDYYEKIRQGKQEKLFHEVIFQIGDRNDTNAKSSEGQLAKQILTDFMGEFQKRNPNLYVFSAHLHMDEQTPHLHIDFVTYVRGSKRGLETRVSFRGALHAQGFPGGSRSETERNQWMEAEKKELAVIMERYGVKWLQKGTHEKHLSVLDFKKQEREKEVAALDIQKQKTIDDIAKLDMEAASRQKELDDTMYRQLEAEAAVVQAGKEEIELRQENSMLSKENGLLKAENGSLAEEGERLGNQNQHLHQIQKNLKTENQELAQEYEMLRADHLETAQEYEKVQSDIQELTQQNESLYLEKQKLEQEEKKLKKKVSQMARSTERLERDVRSYDEDKEWQLPEAGAFMSAKAYRDKSARPLVARLKDRVQSLTIQCVQLMDDAKRLREKVECQGSDIQLYKGRIHEILMLSQQLQDKADDLERVKQYVGAEQIDEILGRIKDQEHMKRQQKRVHCMER